MLFRSQPEGREFDPHTGQSAFRATGMQQTSFTDSCSRRGELFTSSFSKQGGARGSSAKFNSTGEDTPVKSGKRISLRKPAVTCHSPDAIVYVVGRIRTCAGSPQWISSPSPSPLNTSAGCSVKPSLHAFIQESDPVHQKGARRRHLGGERLSSVSPHTKGKRLSEVGFEPTPPERLRPERSALDRSAILTACRANLERVRARSGLYRSCSEIRPPSEAQRDALS